MEDIAQPQYAPLDLCTIYCLYRSIANLTGHRDGGFLQWRRGRVQAENKATELSPATLFEVIDGVAYRRVRATSELQTHLQSNTCSLAQTPAR